MAKKNIENALDLNRIPSSEELFNVGKQPHIPTRGLSTILSDKKEVYPFKIDVDELTQNRFKKRKQDEGEVHHIFY